MNLKAIGCKLAKWTKRWLVSIVTDRRWRDPNVHPIWLGSRSGGAFVDMRYPDQIKTVYSFGIATEISFDRAVIEATDCHVYGFDPDPNSEQWLKREDIWVPTAFHFSRLALYSCTGQRVFSQADAERMSGSLTGHSSGKAINVECRTLQDIMDGFGHDWVDYIKMDIEGAEFDVLNAWLQTYKRLPVGQLWVEFHPDGVGWRNRDVVKIVESLRHVGMMPGYRDFFRYPNSYLLINEMSRDQA